MTRDEKIEAGNTLRKIADDPNLMFAAHLAIEDEAADRRDRMIQVMNRNGIAIYTHDSQPSSIIRIGTREAVQIALRAIANELDKQ